MMTFRLSRFSAAASLVALALATLVSIGPAGAQTVETFADEFNAVSYGGSTGTVSWNGPWVEIGESDGPGSGVVRVAPSDRCRGGDGNCLRIGSAGGYAGDHGVARDADLGDVSSATLSFEFRREGEGNPSGEVRVQISSDGGASWTTLWTVKLKGAQGTKARSRDVTQHATNATSIRFVGPGTDGGAYLHIDHVMIGVSYPPGATTTTTAPPPDPPTTTTTAPSPPPSSTSTTTVVTPPPDVTTTTSQFSRPPTTTTTRGSVQPTTSTTVTAASPTTAPGATGESVTTTTGMSTTTTTTGTSTTTTNAAIVALGAGPPDEGDGRDDPVSPIMGLRVPFATNSEVFSNSLFSLVVLAALTGGLSVAGLETRRKRTAGEPRRSRKRQR